MTWLSHNLGWVLTLSHDSVYWLSEKKAFFYILPVSGINYLNNNMSVWVFMAWSLNWRFLYIIGHIESTSFSFTSCSPVPPGVSAGCRWNAHESASYDQRHVLEWLRCSPTIHTGCCRLLHPFIPRLHHRHGVSINKCIFYILHSG